eukprot:Gb_15694 [translate_table: standard]
MVPQLPNLSSILFRNERHLGSPVCMNTQAVEAGEFRNDPSSHCTSPILFQSIISCKPSVEYNNESDIARIEAISISVRHCIRPTGPVASTASPPTSTTGWSGGGSSRGSNGAARHLDREDPSPPPHRHQRPRQARATVVARVAPMPLRDTSIKLVINRGISSIETIPRSRGDNFGSWRPRSRCPVTSSNSCQSCGGSSPNFNAAASPPAPAWCILVQTQTCPCIAFAACCIQEERILPPGAGAFGGSPHRTTALES